MMSIPFKKGPSHESAPEYEAVRVSPAIVEVAPVRVAVHAGVGSSLPPVGKNMVNVSVVPANAPENVPVLSR
jgi:hypothetical protein